MQSTDVESSGAGLRNYLAVLRRRKWVAIGVFLVTVLAAVGYSIKEKPVYRAETTIVVGQGNSLFQPTFANAVQPFTATMQDLVKSNVVASDVINRLHLTESPEKLLSRIGVSINPQSSALKVAVDTHNRTTSVQIARALGDSFSALVQERFADNTPAVPGQAIQQPLTATIWDPAHGDPRRVAPRPTRNIAIAAALGLVLAVLATFLVDHFDRRLRTRDEIEEAFGLPVIGQVPYERRRLRRDAVTIKLGGRAAEPFRTLRANLQYLGVRRPLRTIVVSSATPGQGKTTVAGSLAVALARAGHRAIAVEADLRRPRLYEAFGLAQPDVGLTSVLVGTSSPEDAINERPVGVLTGGRDDIGSLALLGSGPLPPNPSELLASTQMRSLLDRLANEYDFVLVDSPPLLPIADTLELARLADGVIVVARRGSVTSESAHEVRSLGARLHLNLVGIVLTDVGAAASYGYGDGYDAAVDGAPVPRRERATTK